MILLCLPVLTFGQKVKVKSIEAVYDSTNIVELFDLVNVGFIFHYEDGSSIKTAGFLHGNIRWKSLQVSPNNGTFNNGVWHVNRAQLIQEGFKSTFTIIPADAPQEKLTATIQLPTLTAIRFNHYTDSLKIGIHFYLNVEGIFSSDKILPLDTSIIRFESSAGRLIGQDLLLASKDDSIKFIDVRATVKANNKLTIVTEIPIKQTLSAEDLRVNAPIQTETPSRKKKNQ